MSWGFKEIDTPPLRSLSTTPTPTSRYMPSHCRQKVQMHTVDDSTQRCGTPAHTHQHLRVLQNFAELVVRQRVLVGAVAKGGKVLENAAKALIDGLRETKNIPAAVVTLAQAAGQRSALRARCHGCGGGGAASTRAHAHTHTQ